MAFLDSNDIIKYGKYQFKHVSEIINDHEYCLFLKQQWWYCIDERLQSYIDSNKKNRDMVVHGKHAGRNIAEINEIDPEYVSKLKKNTFILEHCPIISDQFEI